MQVAKETGVTTQMGNQGHAMDGTRQVREIYEAGILGTVREVWVWTDRPIWPQALNRPMEMYHVPPELDWDLWLGPAPYRPYHPDYYAPFNWRGWWDFGTGALGDIACHAMDASFWALDLKNPKRITAETTPLFPETAPAASRITYEFPATDNRPEVKVVWYDGNLKPPRPEAMADHEELRPTGQAFIGDNGALVATDQGNDARLYPTELHNDVMANPPAEKYPRTPGVYREWIEACKAGTQPGSNIVEHSGPLTDMVLLGNLAVRSREIIEWDGATRRVTNARGANQYIEEEYRNGWSLT
jgi:predicted dehydrogenase